jgi:hypothetical protein
MPRIEIIPKGYDFKNGEGTPTINVCYDCAPSFVEGQALPTHITPRRYHTHHEEKSVRENIPKLQKQYPDAKVGSTEVDHPPFSEWDYTCACCERLLGDMAN